MTLLEPVCKKGNDIVNMWVWYCYEYVTDDRMIRNLILMI